MDLICYDFNRICRTCKNEAPDMRPLFDDSARFDEMLMACTSIQIDMQDGLPGLMCKLCINQLLMAYHFKQQCELTDSVLRTYATVNNIHVNHTKMKPNITPEVIVKTEEDEDKPNIYCNSLLDEGHWLNDEINGDNDDSMDSKVDPSRLRDSHMTLSCPTCSKVFTTVDGLKCHQRMHTGDMFQCKQCDKKYTRMNHLHRHELSHGQSKMHICKICNKGLTRYEHLKRHLITHLKEKPFPCHRCNRGFSRWEHLSKHLQRCLGEPVFICEVCNKTFVREESLLAHIKIHEGKEKPLLPTLATLDDIDQHISDHYIETEYDENKMMKSEQNCDGDMEDLEFLEPQVDIEEKEHGFEHDRFNNIENTTISEKVETEPKTPDSNTIEDKKSNSGETTPTKRGRGRPRKDSNISPPFKPEGNFHCQLCDKVFNDIRLFERHEKLHERLKTYQCTVCDKEFSRSYHLKRHMASHMTQKLITCQFCKKNFSKTEYLFEHIKLHMVENLKTRMEDSFNKEDDGGYKDGEYKENDHMKMEFEVERMEDESGELREMGCLRCSTKFDSIEALHEHSCPVQNAVSSP